MNLIFKIIVSLYGLQIALLVGIKLFKNIYTKKHFKNIQEEILFIENVKAINKIEEKDFKSAYLWSFVPIIGYLNVYLVYLAELDYLSRCSEISKIYDEIKINDLLNKLSYEYERLNYKDKTSIDFAKQLIQDKDYKSVVISSSQILLTTLSKISNANDKSTMSTISETINEYVRLLNDLKNSPEDINIKMLEDTKNIFSSINTDLHDKTGVF